MIITGKIPSVIANRLPQLGDNIIVTGSDIDIQVKDKGKVSTLYAVRVGSDWEISELDDSANVFPEYDEADIISADVITKFFNSAITSGLHNDYDMEYDYDHYDILSALSKYADYKEDGLDSVGNTVYEIMWKKQYDENECKDYAEGMEEIYDINFSEDLSKMYISKDVPKDLFEEHDNITSGLILSFNPLGKIKYGVKDKVDKLKDKIGKGVDWLTDKMTLEQAQDLIRKQKGFEQAKVGKIDLMNKKDGGNYKVLVGNPADKTYSVWQLYRNGNEYRIPKKTTGLTADEAVQKYDSLEGNHYDGTKGKTEEEPLEDQTEVKGETQEENNVEEGTAEETQETTSEQGEEQSAEESQEQSAEEVEQTPETEEDNVIYDEDGLKQAQMTEPSAEDKEKLNKSKENGDWQTTDTGEEYVVADEEDNVSEGNAEETTLDVDTSDWDKQADEDYERMEARWKEKLAKQNEEKGKRNKEEEDLHNFVKDYYNDKDEDNISNALNKKRKKKSKYNGCNVTGCEDGNLAGFGTTM